MAANDNPLVLVTDMFKRTLSDYIQRVYIDALDGNQVFVIRDSQALADPISYPTIAGTVFAPGDHALMVRVGGSYIVVGKVLIN